MADIMAEEKIKQILEKSPCAYAWNTNFSPQDAGNARRCFSCFLPGVHLIVTIATVAEKSVIDHSNSMDTSLLSIPAIVTISAIAIARIAPGSIPVIPSVIATISNDRNNHMDTSQ